MVVHGPYPLEETRVERENRVAVEQGFEVDVIAMREPGERLTEYANGVRVIRLPFKHLRGFGLFQLLYEYVGFTLVAAVRVLLIHSRRRYRIVHIHNPPDFLVLAGLIPKLAGSRLILDVHDLAPELFEMRYPDRRGSTLAVSLLRKVEAWAFRRADSIITVHEPYRRELLRRGVPAGKITIVLNTLDEQVVPERPPATERASAFRVVYHGTIIWHYGIGTLVDAVAQLVEAIPDLRLELYGAGDALPGARQRIEDRGLSNRAVVPGRFLPHEEVLALLHDASVGVVANLAIERNKAALPTKLLEYVALGIPVVSSDLPAVREHFTEEEITFFTAGDADSLARALLWIARNRTAAHAKAEAARKRYEDNYSWAGSAERYAAVLQRLAD